MGRDRPPVLAAVSHGGWIMSPRDNHFSTADFPAVRRKFALHLHNHTSYLKVHASNECRVTLQSTGFSPRAAVTRQGGSAVNPISLGLGMGSGTAATNPPSHQCGCMGCSWLCSRSSELWQQRDDGRNTHEVPEWMDSPL